MSQTEAGKKKSLILRSLLLISKLCLKNHSWARKRTEQTVFIAKELKGAAQGRTKAVSHLFYVQ